MSLCCLCSDYLIKHICGRSRNHSSLPPRISNPAEGAMIPGAWDIYIYIYIYILHQALLMQQYILMPNVSTCFNIF